MRWLMLPLAAMLPACAAERPVRDADELRAALAAAQPGDSILLAPGEYAGGLSASDLNGEPDRPIIIGAQDPARRPWLVGGGNAIQLSSCSHLELRDLGIRGQSGNGLNLDDGGRLDHSAHHLTLRNLHIQDIGPRGNHDGIKLSGVRDFVVEDCLLERWGAGSGSAIDMVGCRDGLITGCLFRHQPYEQGSSGVQCKGNTRRITIRGNRFEHAGGRAINLGGSTGLQFFRPPLTPGGEHSEAGELLVEQNVFIGSVTPFAFVGVDGAVVRRNTIYRPRAWLLRILQETREPGFVPCRGGVLEDNLFVWRSDELRTHVNIGPDTAPESFVFRGNAWHCIDQPTRSRPELPAAETEGVYGTEPAFTDLAAGDLRLRPGSALAGKGAD